MNIFEQLERKKLISPRSSAPLTLDEEDLSLKSESGETFNLLSGKVPILLFDEEWARQYSKESDLMLDQYSRDDESYTVQPTKEKKTTLYSAHADAVRSEFFETIGDEELCLSIGGGPYRHHPKLFNLNIAPFHNVDIVADAHHLPYGNGTVDHAYAKSVFEHLHSPHRAAAEMARVLKSGGKAFIDSPFLFVYHGYPHHYQNFTLTGHRMLFEQQGLKVVDAGVSVGPGAGVAQVVNHFIAEYLQGASRQVAKRFWRLVVPLLRSVDRNENLVPKGHLLAGNTFVLLEKD